jgi:hypothetical protein
MKTKASPFWKSAIFWGLVFSFLWLTVGWYIGYQADVDEDGRTFSVMSADQWGTYLAGIFAPLTFPWVVLAVWLQTKELKEQREELAMNRSVMEAHRVEAHNQAEFIGTQTEILKEQLDQQRRRDADDVLLAQIKMLRSWCQSEWPNEPGGPVGFFSVPAGFGYEEYFLEICRRLNDVQEHRHQTGIVPERDLIMLARPGGMVLEQLIMRLLNIGEQAASLTPARQELLRDANIEQLLPRLHRKLRNYSEEYEAQYWPPDLRKKLDLEPDEVF